jgi:hypothetical protein
MVSDTGTEAAAAAIDEAYEFSAPRFFDFINEETEDAVRAAESWFEAARSHAPSRTYTGAPPRPLLVDRHPSLPPRPASSSTLIPLAEFSLILSPLPDCSFQPQDQGVEGGGQGRDPLRSRGSRRAGSEGK